MNKKKKSSISNRNILLLLTIACVCAIVLTVSEVVPITPLRQAASVVIVPFHKGLNAAADWINEKTTGFQNTEALASKVDELEAQVSRLQEENLVLTEKLEELDRFEALYDTDNTYSQYEKIPAKVISKGTGNLYSTFMIDKGTDDGIAVDMNVITTGGLVGLVTEAGTNWANVRSIIDESSSVSAMTLISSDDCIVNGDLKLMETGTLYFDQMNTDETILPGEKLITSNISSKYLPGILIGTITEVNEDSNHLTKTGYLVPGVDFRHISEVLVIKQLKSTYGQ